jgi:hypothetical protein
MAEYGIDMAQAPPARVQRFAQPAATLTQWFGAILSLCLVAWMLVWGYRIAVRDVSGVPVVQAIEGPMRVAPADPGGNRAEHQGLAVNTVASAGAAEGPVDSVVIAPRPAGLAEEDVALGLLDARSAEDPRLAPSGAPAVFGKTAIAFPSDTPLAQDSDPGIRAVVSHLSGAAPGRAPLSEQVEKAGRLTGQERISGLGPGVQSGPDLALMDPSAAQGFGNIPPAPFTPPPEAVTDLPTVDDEGGWTGKEAVRVSLRPLARPAGAPSPATIPDAGAAEDPIMAAIRESAALLMPAAPIAAPSGVRETNPDTLPPGTRLVQIGAFDSAETARAQWDRLVPRFGAYLAGKTRVIQRATSGGRVFYRLRAHGFVDLADARRFCAAFVAGGVDCIPVTTR